MKKVAFPHMGNLFVIAKALFEELGFEVVIPPYNNKSALEIGKRISPECICLPFKLNMGNFIQAIEMGADTIVIFGGCGPCRFGYYGALEKEIIKDLGYDVEMIVIEPLFYGLRNFLEQVSKIFARKNIASVLKRVYRLAKKVDGIEKKVHFLRPREMVKGSVDKIYERFRKEALKVCGIDQMERLVDTTNVLLDNLYIVNEKVRKIGIVGEIYTIIDSFSSLNIEKILGEMGCEVERNLYISQWIDTHLIYPIFKRKDPIVKRYSKGIMPALIGGHARETISYAKYFAAQKYDGILHIFPLTCMPEIIAKSVLNGIKNQINIPILHVVIDEVDSDVGIKTRLEAFLDLIEARSDNVEQRLLSWD
ncbi:hypothetical protein Calow_1245 [Caldicellulosiruptor owensensis OL]|uniref:DUF2229 domain-containing protein n=1 Tax=Caldicellulosiruptor owensensis (strain ATCC 700167 / DSM 13100 / OL) TaxID=632518 RepID=E4Q1R9_CALOW|nr:acyl-CoA dehydratase activase-related protein [Caldicellulosiruptor owensensis]ADQ04803.1 hypothetical protein Calow_1245 [Caldicellulosiruptor owensensis OL]